MEYLTKRTQALPVTTRMETHSRPPKAKTPNEPNDAPQPAQTKPLPTAKRTQNEPKIDIAPPFQYSRITPL